ncbi:MAG: hypothetical protein QM642_07240 [Edaphocola sp.]
MKKNLLLAFCLWSGTAVAQTTYLPLRTDEYHLLDRLQTLNGRLSNDFHSSIQPIPRKGAATYLLRQRQDVNNRIAGMGSIDYYNTERALSISGEWSETADGDDGTLDSRKPILKCFYAKQPDCIHVNNDDFFMVANPVVYLQAGSDSDMPGLRYISTRGMEARGRILDRLGFYTLIADNQEKAQSYFYQWANRYDAYPGFDYFTQNGSTMLDAFMARGYVDAGFAQEHINVTFGYDKQFKGDGLRSMLLSDFAAPATFLRLRTQVGKLVYENLYLQLTAAYQRSGGDRLLPRKYAALHHLSMNVLPRLNLGVFESTIFGGTNAFGAQYLIPIIGYNTVARSLGADQKTSLGLNFKALPARGVQVYGQLYADGLNLGKISDSYWGNQYALQLGLKYFDAFALGNLDLQIEGNVVRPFTYSANDGVEEYSHYNQPLAYQYGSGTVELTGLVQYQPVKRMTIAAKGMYLKRGDESSDPNSGTNIFAGQWHRMGDYGYGINGNGLANSNIYLNLNINYEARPNIFPEIGFNYLDQRTAGTASTYFYAGLRWNIARRENDVF